jgi:histidine triad (HIT) family protein
MALFLRLARSPVGKSMLGWVFAHMSFAIPVKRLRETETLMAFHHPQPSHPVHILIVPKRAIHSLSHLTRGDSDFILDLFRVVQGLIDEFNLEETGYRLIVNGGEYQEAPQLHFHLVSGA